MENKIFAERLKEKRNEAKLSQKELGDIASCSRYTVMGWEQGKTPTLEVMRKIAVALNTSVTYLSGETDDPTPPQSSRVSVELQSNLRPIPPEDMIMVPMVSPEIKVCAGDGNSYGVDVPELEVVGVWPLYDPKLSALYSSRSLSSMTVEGDSMEPQIHDGDIVVFNHDSAWVPGNVMVVCLDGRLMVKGIISQGEGKPPILRSTNRDYMDIQVSEDSFFLVYGRVLRIIRVSNPKPVI